MYYILVPLWFQIKMFVSQFMLQYSVMVSKSSKIRPTLEMINRISIQ